MAMHNDPRFFTHNVIDKRLAAFKIAGFVSVFMVKVSVQQVFNYKKDINFNTFDPSKDPDGWFQIIGFYMMCFTLFFYLTAVYTMIAQIYHTYRLMTAGPTGFEMATSYYLNKNIVFWRHFSIKLMMGGLPLLLLSTGIRMMIKFDRDMIKKNQWISYTKPTISPVPPGAIQIGNGYISIMGLITLALFWIGAIFIYSVHRRHTAVFKERYAMVMCEEDGMVNFLTHVEEMSARGRGVPLNV
jgi:hypothetical protein